MSQLNIFPGEEVSGRKGETGVRASQTSNSETNVREKSGLHLRFPFSYFPRFAVRLRIVGGRVLGGGRNIYKMEGTTT
jgi:hypothetical protein